MSRDSVVIVFDDHFGMPRCLDGRTCADRLTLLFEEYGVCIDVPFQYNPFIRAVIGGGRNLNEDCVKHAVYKAGFGDHIIFRPQHGSKPYFVDWSVS